MTSKPATEPDSDPGEAEFYSVAAVEDIAKAAVRAALPLDRQAMWPVFLDAMQDAA
jgi:hypothetical protein